MGLDVHRSLALVQQKSRYRDGTVIEKTVETRYGLHQRSRTGGGTYGKEAEFSVLSYRHGRNVLQVPTVNRPLADLFVSIQVSAREAPFRCGSSSRRLPPWTTHQNLTDESWALIELCCNHDPRIRPDMLMVPETMCDPPVSLLSQAFVHPVT